MYSPRHKTDSNIIQHASKPLPGFVFLTQYSFIVVFFIDQLTVKKSLVESFLNDFGQWIGFQGDAVWKLQHAIMHNLVPVLARDDPVIGGRD